MKTILFFLLKNLYFIRKINSVLIFLTFLLGIFLLFYSLIYDQEFISSRLILILPFTYFLSELLLLVLYYLVFFLERRGLLDLEKINSKHTIVFLKKNNSIKKGLNIIVGNLRYAWSDSPDFLDVYVLIKSKFIGLIIGAVMLLAWPIFYEQPPGIFSGWLIFFLLYGKVELEDLEQ